MKSKEAEPKRRVRQFAAFMSSVLIAAACQNSPVQTPRPSGEVLGASTGPTSQGENFYLGEGDATGQVLGASTGPMSEIFPEFINKYKGTEPDFDKSFGPQCEDLINFWSKRLGGKQFTGLHSYQIFGQYPDFYASIPNDGSSNPQMGDIIDWKAASWNGGDGHTAIVDHQNSDGSIVVWEENGASGVAVQEHTYTLTSDVQGWLRDKEYITPPSDLDLINQNLPQERAQNPDAVDPISAVDQEGINQMVGFWFKTYATKEQPFRYTQGEDTTVLQLQTNLSTWAPNIMTMASFSDMSYSRRSEPINNNPFEISFTVTHNGVTRNGKVQIDDLEAQEGFTTGLNDTFSDMDRRNGWQFRGGIELNYIYRTQDESGNWSDWMGDDGSPMETITAVKKDNQWYLNDGSKYLTYTYTTGDPQQVFPTALSFIWRDTHFFDY